MDDGLVMIALEISKGGPYEPSIDVFISRVPCVGESLYEKNTDSHYTVASVCHAINPDEGEPMAIVRAIA